MGHRRRPEHFISLIDKVSRDDLNRIGRKMLDTKAAVAAIGSLKKLPSYSDIEIGLLDKDVSSQARWRFLAPSGAQGVTLSVCLSVRHKVLILLLPIYFWLISSSRLQDDFVMTSG